MDEFSSKTACVTTRKMKIKENFLSDSENGKNGAFKKTNIKKRGISEKKHVINFKTEKEPEMKWGISKKIV